MDIANGDMDMLLPAHLMRVMRIGSVDEDEAVIELSAKFLDVVAVLPVSGVHAQVAYMVGPASVVGYVVKPVLEVFGL